MASVLWMVIPCYNEEAVLPVSRPVLKNKMESLISSGRISPESRVLFVNDGSSDATWSLIERFHEEDPLFCGISLAHNAGEQNAYLAGMFTAVSHADAVITMDCDLQDDINAVDEMLTRFGEGCEIVYGVRAKREHDPLRQRFTSSAFYKLMHLIGSELPEEHSQFRLMSTRAIEMLADYGEVNMFLPALVPEIGLKTAQVQHERFERAAGESNYSFVKLVRLAVEAVTSFSSAPLVFITLFAILSGLFFLACAVLTVVRLVSGGLSGNLLLLDSLWLIGTMLFVGLRILGEYICKNYRETKKRPRYHIAETLLDE